MFNKYFFKVLASRTVAESGNITARDIAVSNGIEYMDSICQQTVIKANGKQKIYINGQNLFQLFPLNDGKFPTEIQWYDSFGEIILDNMSSFDCITNINQIILQIIMLYQRYLDEDVIISPDGFYIKLEGKIKPNYVGEAKLLLAECCVLNQYVKHDKIRSAKVYFINEFLNNYIGLNFGLVIKKHPDLEKALIDFNKLVIKRNFRKPEQNNSGIQKFTSMVRPYKLKET